MVGCVYGRVHVVHGCSIVCTTQYPHNLHILFIYNVYIQGWQCIKWILMRCTSSDQTSYSHKYKTCAQKMPMKVHICVHATCTCRVYTHTTPCNTYHYAHVYPPTTSLHTTPSNKHSTTNTLHPPTPSNQHSSWSQPRQSTCGTCPSCP